MMNDLVARVKTHEGLRLVPYVDSMGYPTIGYGHAIQSDERFTSLTEPEADQLLYDDLTRAINAVNRNLPWVVNLPENVREVLYEMSFQLGIYKLLKFTTTLKCASRGDFSGMAAAMLQSMWAKETPARAQNLAALVAGAEPNKNVLPLTQPQTQTA